MIIESELILAPKIRPYDTREALSSALCLAHEFGDFANCKALVSSFTVFKTVYKDSTWTLKPTEEES